MSEVTAARRTHFAALMLMVATAAWAVSFSLAKDAGGRLNELAGLGHGAFFGPVALQGVRFCLAAVVWFTLIPSARRGWSWVGVWRGGYVGVLLGAGIMLQHLSLENSSPATTAFLTGLTVLWVPVVLCFVRRRLPGGVLLVGVLLAVVGLYLMLGEGLTTFRRGDMLGLGCSVVFAFHLMAVSDVVRKENAWRMCGAQFVVCGVICLVPAMAWGRGPGDGGGGGGGVGFLELGRMVLDGGVGWRLGVILLFPTFLSFGLMNVYQQYVDSTRATLIYQGEPVLAAGFDWVVAGRGMGGMALVGAGFILAANLVAELMPRMKGEGEVSQE